MCLRLLSDTPSQPFVGYAARRDGSANAGAIDELSRVQSCRMLKDELGRLEANDPLKVIVRRGDVLVSVEMVTPKKGEE